MLAWLERRQLLVLAAAVVALLAVVLLRPTGDAAPTAPIVINEASLLPEGTPIRVQVAGAVLRPGVVSLKSGDRLADALTAAGGANAEADIETLNLAGRLRDGEQVTVPQKPKRNALVAAATAVPGARLNLNSATESQLDALPGVGATYAQRIIDSRSVDGPFKATQDLVDRRILPKATYDKLRELVAAP